MAVFITGSNAMNSFRKSYWQLSGKRKRKILVYICAFSSQAIFHGVLRIERRGRVSLLPGPIERNLISGGICERE